MIDKVYRIIYIGSISIMVSFFILIILGLLFFNGYKNAGSIERIVGILALITPFAPIGTLFGTLKENQSTRKKMKIIFYTGLSVFLLLLFIWGSIFAATLD